MAISINKQSEEVQNQIIEAYKNNMSLREIEKTFNTTRQTVSRFLEERGIKTQKGNHYRKYFHNENFFETIDSEEKAYWLGFMYADGWILDNSQRYGQDHFGISLIKSDEEHLKKFAKAIEATNPITYDNSKRQHPLAKIVLTSQKTVDDLIRHGCFKKKTFILQPPTTVPDELIYHFIRGFFDGDGSLVKCGGKFFEKYHRYEYSIAFSCMQSIAYWLQELFGYGSVIQDKRTEHSFTYTIGGKNCVYDFYSKVYKNATIYLDRKYEKFQGFLIQEKFDESQGI